MFAVLFVTTLDMAFGFESVRKRHFGNLPVAVLIVLPSPSSVKSKVELLPWTYDKKNLSEEERVCLFS